MADESSGQEKTEEPTDRRLQEARKKGDVAKSMEVPSAAVLFAGLITLYMTGEYILGQSYIILKHYLANAHLLEVTPENITVITKNSMYSAALILAPLMLVIFIVALVANYAQVGVLFTTEKITPKFENLDVIKGIGKLFSKQTLANAIKSIAKLAIVGLVAYMEIKKAYPELLPLMDQQPISILAFMVRIAFWIFLKCALIIAVLAAMDYAFQRWQFMEKMKMTKQEIKDEAKQTEGDPHVKGRIRSIQMQMARQRMMAEVPQADVVITNPTRLAVALKYDPSSMTAPMVVAKGSGFVAKRIKEIAAEHGVPLVEDKPLAQALFHNVEIDQPIPDNLFQTVAEVLAYVYGLKGKMA